METRYIKLNFNEALYAKKQLLSSEINLINLLSRMRNYKFLRNKESFSRGNIKREIRFIKSNLNQINSFFPEEEVKQIKTEKVKAENKEKILPVKNTNNFKSELEQIKHKLAKLG